MNLSPLHQAAADGDWQRIQQLLAEGCDPNIPRDAGWRPLHDAADNTGSTPLHLAVSKRLYDAAELLLAAGATPTLTNRAGQTPLDLARSKKMRRLLGEDDAPAVR